MASISDVTVVLNVETPSVPVNMGNLAVFVKGVADKIESFSALEDVKKAHSTEKGVTQVADGYFSQADHGSKLVVVTYSDDVVAAADKAYSAGWEFATLVPGTEDGNAADAAGKLAGYIAGKAERFYVSGEPATAETVTNADTIVAKLGKSKRAIVFVSGATADEAEYGVGALVGAVGNETVGSVTWKFKSLGGVKPADYSASDIQTLHDAGLFTYVEKAGVAQTSEGKTAAGEYIDALHGDDWVKATIETELQHLLSSSKKLTFDSTGIAQIDAVVTTVLNNATSNGIILTDKETGAGDFSVTTVSRANTPTADIAERRYNGLSFSYTRAGAIHSVKVSGQINL